jgi:hypothetical protein
MLTTASTSRPASASRTRTAAGRARKAVLVAQARDEPDPGDAQTATADCADFGNSPCTTPDGCAASFLMCLGCQNARVGRFRLPRIGSYVLGARLSPLAKLGIQSRQGVCAISASRAADRSAR